MGLKQDLENATVDRMNNRDPVTIDKTATVHDAVQKMRAAGMGCVIVTDADDKAVGIFTEGMLRHGLNEGPEILDEVIEDQMVARLPWVLPSDSVKMVLDAMEEHNIRFIAVLDEDRHVVGLSGQKTLMEFVAGYFPQEVFTHDPDTHSTSTRREGA
ncbi:MAG: CBS domain-containing protein [Planctomycetaceae bacterium]